MPKTRAFVVAGTLVCLAGLSPGSVRATTLTTTRVLAKSGDASPDGTGVLFQLVGATVLNAAGQVAFESNIYNQGFAAGSAIFRCSTPTDLTLIVRASVTTSDSSMGWPAPDGNGYFSPLDLPAIQINASGQVSFFSRLLDTFAPAEMEGIFVGSGGQQGLIQIVRGNDPVPNTQDVVTDLTTPGAWPSLDDAGRVSFQAVVSSAAQALLTGDGSPGSLVEVVRGGQPAPGGIGNWLSFISPAPLNQDGDIAFGGCFGGSCGGVFRSQGSEILPIALNGDTSPDGNGTFLGLGVVAPEFNDSGQAAFFDPILLNTMGGSSDNAAIFRGDGTSLVVIARRGDLTPGGNGRLLDIQGTNFGFNDLGQVLFTSTITGAQNGSAAGLFRGDGVQLTTVARVNDPAPGGPGVFSKFEPETFALNDQGQAVFQAFIDLGDGGGTQDTEGLFLFDDVHGVRALARLGDLVPGAVTIGGLYFTGQANAFHAGPSGLNDQGVVAYRFAGNDGNYYIAITTPEPGGEALAVTAVASLALVARCKRGRAQSAMRSGPV